MTAPPVASALLDAGTRESVLAPYDLERLRSLVVLEGMHTTAEELLRAPGTPLHRLANGRLTGHIAGSVGLEQRRLGRLVVDELERWIAGEHLQHQVTEEQSRLRA